jgi:hypothetical protein
MLLSTFTVVLATDSGSPAGQKVTATTGDLRYCIEQADAAHSATSDTIDFASALTATAHTIALDSANGPLVLNDSHPLTINGPAARTINISGENAVEVFDIAGGTVTINNLAITHGNAANGGGIFNQGILTLSNCSLDHDAASSSGGGGGLFNLGTAHLINCTLNLDSAAFGGGIVTGPGKTVTLTNCNLSNDRASSDGGGIFNFGGTVTLTNTILSNDSAFGTTSDGDGGGAILDAGTATLSNCTLSNDSATADGGAIFVPGGATATLTNCTVSNDLAFGSKPSSDGGGGMFDAGTVTLRGCTLNNNFAIAGASLGGGILVFTGGAAKLTNCTLANNTAGFGGGIYNLGTATVTNCTIAYNSADSTSYVGGAGGGIDNVFATLTLTNTIVAQNTATAAIGPDIASFSGTIIADHDLIGADTGSGIANGGGNLVGTSANPIDPRLGPLQNNGGPTQTIALLADSPAIGQADNSKAPATDQRGITRVTGPGEFTDIGAFEF